MNQIYIGGRSHVHIQPTPAPILLLLLCVYHLALHLPTSILYPFQAQELSKLRKEVQEKVINSAHFVNQLMCGKGLGVIERR